MSHRMIIQVDESILDMKQLMKEKYRRNDVGSQLLSWWNLSIRQKLYDDRQMKVEGSCCRCC